MNALQEFKQLNDKPSLAQESTDSELSHSSKLHDDEHSTSPGHKHDDEHIAFSGRILHDDEHSTHSGRKLHDNDLTHSAHSQNSNAAHRPHHHAHSAPVQEYHRPAENIMVWETAKLKVGVCYPDVLAEEVAHGAHGAEETLFGLVEDEDEDDDDGDEDANANPDASPGSGQKSVGSGGSRAASRASRSRSPQPQPPAEVFAVRKSIFDDDDDEDMGDGDENFDNISIAPDPSRVGYWEEAEILRQQMAIAAIESAAENDPGKMRKKIAEGDPDYDTRLFDDCSAELAGSVAGVGGRGGGAAGSGFSVVKQLREAQSVGEAEGLWGDTED